MKALMWRVTRLHRTIFMPWLVPGIHVFVSPRQDVDGQDEPGRDDATNSGSERVRSLGAGC
jgi:hypothetical protein